MSNLETKKQEQRMGLLLLMAGAFLFHIICALFYTGHATDISCFSSWANLVFEHGPSEFYYLKNADGTPIFTDYPPGYMYILWVVGAMHKLFGVSGVTSAGTVLFIKLPAMLCDIGIGYVIYLISKKYTKHNTALLAAAAYMFNPVVILNSSIWGQVDSVFTLCVLLMCYFITNKKLTISYFVFAVGILIKPQTMIFTPVLIYGIVEQVFLNDFDMKKMLKELGMGLLAIATLFLLAAPYGIPAVVNQYVETLGSYEHASVNAYNMWTLFGKNWASQEDVFLILSCKNWGSVFIVLTVVLSGVFFFKNKDSESKYYMTGAFIVTSMFMTSVRMHERYMYPAIALFLAAAIVKRHNRMFYVYTALSFVHLLNTAHVLFVYDPQNYNPNGIQFMAFLSIAAFVYFCMVLFKEGFMPRLASYEELLEQKQNKKSSSANNQKRHNNKNNSNNRNRANNKNYTQGKNEPVKKSGWDILPSFVSSKWVKADFIVMLAITVVYACIAFWRLGDFDAPQSEWYGKQGDEIVLDFGEVKSFDKFFTFLGYHENRRFDLSTSIDGKNWEKYVASNDDGSEQIDVVSVFCWNEQQLGRDTRYVKFGLTSEVASVMEFMFYDISGNVLTPVNTADYPTLFDEQDIFDGKYSFMNSTYFDEIYHGRTAYEMLHGVGYYETTHPPLGKWIMSLGILIFGMCPFGWRFMGTLFGVLMLPIMYMLARKLTDKTWLSGIFTVLFALDFMHFTQTRIATIDVYVTLFIMLEYYFMLKYYRMSFYDTPFRKTLIPLLLSGICMGLGCAAKWTGVYAGVGLAVVFFAVLFRRYMEYKRAMCTPKESTAGISHSFIIDNFRLYIMKTISFCLVAFVAIPLVIYTLSYIPVYYGNGEGLVAKMIASQELMFNYHAHSVLDSTHPYSSTWAQWPTMARPMLYYVESVGDGVSEAISAFGNPLIWWVGIPAFGYMIYLVFKKRDRIAFFLAIGALAQYIPWTLVERCTFIYHYFPTVPFLVMMIGYSIYKLVKDNKKLMYATFGYVALVFAMFVLFYPVIAAYPMSVDFAEKFLKWFEGWVLIF